MADYIQKMSGFLIGAKQPVDKRLLLTKNEMLTGKYSDSGRTIPLPSKYFSICSDDGFIYLYDELAEASAETGKFKKLDVDLSQYSTTEEVVAMLALKQDLITDQNKLSYNLLKDTPTIPDPTNFVTTQAFNYFKTTLSAVATSGNYNDLTNKPTIPSIEGLATEAYVDGKVAGLAKESFVTSSIETAVAPKADKTVLEAHTGNSDIHITAAERYSWDAKQNAITSDNKLSASLVSGLANVATSGSYGDLLNKPTIPSVYDSKISFKKGTEEIGYINLNQAQDKSIDVKANLGDLGITTTAEKLNFVDIDSSLSGLLAGKENADATILKQANVVDSLESSSEVAPLSAHQGKVLKSLIDNLPSPMVFKGTVGVGGTVSDLPTSGVRVGDTYKVISDGTYAGQPAVVGDMFIASAKDPIWVHIPSGDEPKGTVTKIETGTGLTGGPITTSGSISVDFTAVEAKDSTILRQADVKNNLTSEDTNKPLAAKQGKELNSLINTLDGAKINKTDIIDGLTSDDATKVLSAKQGKALNTNISTVSGNVTTLSSTVASHTGNKSNPHTVTKDQVGLGNVENKSAATINSEITYNDILTKVEYDTDPGSGLAKTSDIESGKSTFNLSITKNNGIDIAVADWSSQSSGAYYQAVKTISGVTANSKPVLDIVIDPTEYATVDEKLEAWSKIYSAVSGDGNITFYAKEAPTVAIKVQAIGF